jgi:amino acid adenylation domain-containing protein
MSRVLQNKRELSPTEKRALLTELLRRKSAEGRAVPASFAQQRLWFLDQLEPQSAAFNLARATRIKGRLDHEALKQTLNALVARHESLRTNFGLREGEPVQIISPVRDCVLSIVDLRGLGEQAEDEARRLAVAESDRGFDLARDHLLRATLFLLNDHEHVLLPVMHHIVSDGWSMGVLQREIGTLYEAFVNGRPNPLPDLPIQYADFAVWQRGWLQGEMLQQELDYWSKQLAGMPPTIELATDRPRPAIQTINGAYHHRKLTKQLSDSLAALSRREGATLFMTLLAAFQALLSRYTEQNDIAIGTPIANRTRKETEGLIGFFVNTLVMRTDLSGNPSFRDLLKRAREVALGAYEHQDLPFEKLVAELKPERSLSHMPLFQVLFAVQNVPRTALTLGTLELEDFPFTRQLSKFDLSLYVGEPADGLSLSFEYNTNLFDEATIARMADHFETLLKAIVADPDQLIAYLPLIPDDERRLLDNWNRTESAFPREIAIHQLFERQTAETPDQVALIFGDSQMTFSELNARANQLARYIRKRGVDAESRVAICLERSPALVVSVLAILKAGAAYVPLEPIYPSERAAYILKDSKARLLLTESRHLASLPPPKLEIVSLDADWAAIAEESTENPDVSVGGDNAAYVIYTSGSTGRPKGVVGLHRGMINRFTWMWRAYPFVAGDVGCQKTSVGFLDSMWEIFGHLLKGVPLVIIPDDVVKDPYRFVETLRAHKVTRLVLVPSLLRAMLQLPDDRAKRLDDLRYCVSSGEALPLDLAEDFRKQFPHTRLLNLYGSSEVSADVTFYEVTDIGHRPSVPIGRPIANTQVHILDKNLQPAPIGVVGDIYIGGESLSRGYLDQAELTAEKFVASSSGDGSGSCLFKMGDLGRYLNDGNIEYRGRRDHQVKVRGFRVELGEIETVLATHSQVRQVVVVVREEEGAEKRIVAYVVPDGPAPAASELRDYLRPKLLDYMIPSAFVILEELPLTPGGKVDRLSLPEPSTTLAGKKNDIARPLTEYELALKNIWEALLKVNPIGVRDDFFALGGHSLLAVRMLNEVEKLYHRRIPLVSLFQSATIEHLGKILAEANGSITWPTLVEIQKGNAKPPLFCVSVPNVNALGYVTLARHLGPAQPVYGLQAQYPEDLQGEHSQKAVDELATEYLKAVREVHPHGPYQFVGMCRGAHIAFELARRLEGEGEEVALVGILDTWVMENTYNKFLYVRYYARRLQAFMRLGARDQLQFIKKKTLRKGKLGGGQPVSSGNRSPALANPMKTYFPGPDFQPKTYRGRVSVFRARRQPLDRIRDKELGWSKLALGGVDLHYVPGKHGESVLREPHVRVLADELKQCLVH